MVSAPQLEENKEEPMKLDMPSSAMSESCSTPLLDLAPVLERQKSSAIEEDKGGVTSAMAKAVSYTTMTHLLTQFKDEAQLKKLEEMLEYIKTEVDKSREKIKKLDEDNSALRKKFKEAT